MFCKTVIFAVLIFYHNCVASPIEETHTANEAVENAGQLITSQENDEDILSYDPLWGSDKKFNIVNDYFSGYENPNVHQELIDDRSALLSDPNLVNEENRLSSDISKTKIKGDASINDEDDIYNYDLLEDNVSDFDLDPKINSFLITNDNFDILNDYDPFRFDYSDPETKLYWPTDYNTEYDYNYDPNVVVSDKFGEEHISKDDQENILDISNILSENSDAYLKNFLTIINSKTEDTYKPDSGISFSPLYNGPIFDSDLQLENNKNYENFLRYIENHLGHIEQDLNTDIQFSKDYLASQNIDSGVPSSFIINFDGEIIPNQIQELASKGKGSEENNLELINLFDAKLSDSNSQFLKEYPSNETEKVGILVYQKFIIYPNEKNDLVRKDNLAFKLDSSYVDLVESKSSKNIAALRFIGPVLMVLGLLVTLSVIFIAVSKRNHGCQKHQEKLSGGSYHTIQEV